MNQKKSDADNKVSFITPTVLPDGNGGYTPCPELLTPQEAVRYLRLDTTGSKRPLLTLRHYRQQHKLQVTRLGKRLLYSRRELDRFIEIMTG